jgi:hypothetical protein
MVLAIRVVIFLGLVMAVLFGFAGRWDLPFFWIFLGVVLLFLIAFRLLTDADLRQERLGPGSGRSKSHAFRLAAAPFFLGLLVVSGLDAGRFHWSAVPLAVQVVGMVGLSAG